MTSDRCIMQGSEAPLGRSNKLVFNDGYLNLKSVKASVKASVKSYQEVNNINISITNDCLI